jgi:subtilisin family serine protease
MHASGTKMHAPRDAAHPFKLQSGTVRTLVALLVGIASATTAPESMAFSPKQEEIRRHLTEGRAHVPGEILIQFRSGVTAVQQAALIRRLAASKVSDVLLARNRADQRGDLIVVRLPAGRAVLTGLTAMSQDPTVEFAEPNWVYTTQQTTVSAPPNDPNLGHLWGMLSATTSPSNAQGIGALALWTEGKRCDPSVHVGVIDEGVMISHPDLKANVWVNALEAKANRRDDDGNGFVDDANGWDFAGRNNSVYDGIADDHGSHVAGTIAASANNATGVFGACPSAKLITAKFIGSKGGTTSNAIAAVRYITDLKQRKGLRIVATNNSWGGGGYSQALYDAIKAAGDQNILFVAAAGNANQNIDLQPSYPAAYSLPNLIAVAAIDASGQRASFSNYGAERVHLAAPGVNILSTVPTSSGQPGLAYYNGTSMATPHVTGAAAMFASLNPGATAAQIKEALLCSAAVSPQLVGSVNGARRLDISKFVANFQCPALP